MDNSPQRHSESERSIPDHWVVSTASLCRPFLALLLGFAIYLPTTSQLFAQSYPSFRPGDYALTTERLTRDIKWYHDTPLTGPAIIDEESIVEILDYAQITKSGQRTKDGYTIRVVAKLPPHERDDTEYIHGIFDTYAIKDELKHLPSDRQSYDHRRNTVFGSWVNPIEHGDHFHYVPAYRDPDVPIGEFPTQRPSQGMIVTPGGELTRKQQENRDNAFKPEKGKPFLLTTGKFQIGKSSVRESLYFDVIHIWEDRVTIYGVKSDPVSISKEKIKEENARIEYIDWNYKTNKVEHFKTALGYVFFMGPLFYNYPIVVFLFLGISFIYWRAVTVDRETEVKYILFGFACIIIFTVFNLRGGYVEADLQEKIQSFFYLHSMENGYFVPVWNPEKLARTEGSWVEVFTFIYVPLTFYLAGSVIYFFPSFVRGLHYLSLPEPTDEHVAPTEDDLPPDIDEEGFAEKAKEVVDSSMRPAWMARNEAKKARANTEKIRSWRKLVETVRNYKVTRSQASDQNDDSE